MTEAGRITAIIDGDISALTSKLSQARSQAVSSVSGIENDLKSKLGAGLSGALSGGDFGTAGKKIGGSLVDSITSSFGPLGGAVGEVATALGPAGIVATAAVAGAVIIGSAASGAAREWESGMSQISKTTGIEKGSTGFESLSGELKDLTSTMPTTVSEIQGVASAAGSLGIAQGSIAGFTNVALQMGSAFDMPAEQAAVSMGRIKGQIKTFPDEVKDAFGKVDDAAFAKNFGSAVDYVGNSFNATEKDVLDFATRTSGSLSALGGNAYEIAGWGGMLSSVFPSAERAAGSFDSLLTNLTTNTDAQTAASELLGVSTEDFMKSMTTDPSSTLLNIGKAMEGLPTDKLMGVAKDLGGSYGMDVLTKMVGHTEEWGDAIDQTVEAGQKGESIGSSFAAGADTVDKGMQVMKNSIGMILTDMGGPINAAIAPVISSLAGSFNAVRKIGENLWGPFTAAISPATTAISTLASGIGAIGGMNLDSLVAVSEAINTGFEVGSAFVSAFGEEISNVITESETFQKITGYVDSLKTAISGISLDSIINGFSSLTGIDLSGMIDGLKSQLSGITQEDVVSGISGVTGISEDTVGGVADFLGNVYDNAAEKLGWSVEEGTEDGMEAGSEKAKDKVADDVTDAVKVGVNDGFDAAKEALEKAGVSKEIAGQMAAYGYSDLEALNAINRQTSRNRDNIIDTNIKLRDQVYILRNAAESQGSIYKLLSSSGDLIGSTKLLTPVELGSFNAISWATSLLPKQDLVLDAFRDFSKNIEDEMSGAGEEISTAYLNGMDFDQATIMDHLYNLQMLKFYDPDEAKAQGVDAATDYMESLIQAVSEYDTAKADYLLAPNDADSQAAFEASAKKLQDLADDMPISMKLTADDSDFIKVMTAYFQGGNIDWNSLGVSNPQRYLEYAKEQLSSEVGTYSEQGRIPEGETLTMFQALQGWFKTNYGSLDAINRQSSYLLDQAIAKGGTYWDQLYAHMGLLSTEVSNSGKSVKQDVAQAGTGFVQQTGSSTAPVFQATDYFKLQTNAAGKDIAVIGSDVRQNGQIGGAAMASGGQTGGNAIANACITGARYLVDAATNLKYNSLSDLPTGSNISGSNYYPLSTAVSQQVSSQAAKALVKGPWSESSDLAQWGGVPQGWASSMDQAQTATSGATQSTDSLCASTSSLQSGAASASSGVAGLSNTLYQLPAIFADVATGIANSFYPLADVSDTSYTLQKSAYDTSEALSLTAESMDDWCEAASDFAYWQETTEGLFYDSYIGPTQYYPGAQSSYSPSYSSPSSYSLPAIFGSSSSFSDAFGWVPAFASEGYVSSPMLAKIGDRPGGEYVVGAARFENAVAKMGSGGIVINYSPTINGAGLSADEISTLLEKHEEALITKISEASEGF